MSLGFEWAGFHVCGAVESDKHAKTTYERYHRVPVLCGDVSDFSEEHGKAMGEVSVVVGGPPCQSFSSAGRQEEDDPRGRLFEQYARIVSLVRPLVFVLENVAVLETMRDGEPFKEITGALGACGYHIHHSVLDASDYGVPQARQRLFIVGTRQDMFAPGFEFPIPNREKRALRDVIFGMPRAGKTVKDAPIDGHFAPYHRPEVVELIKKIPREGRLVDVAPGLRKAFDNSYSRLSWDAPASTVTASFSSAGSARCIHPTEHRALTIREAARIQTLPDDMTFAGGIVDQRRQVANAVPPLLAEALARSVLRCLDSLKA